MFADIFRQLSGYRLAYACVVALSMLEAVLAAISITALIPVGGAMVGEGAAATPWPLSELSDLAQASPAILLFFLGGVLVLKVLVALANVFLTAHIKRRMWQRWARQLVEAQLFMPYRDWLKQDSGDLINLTTRELGQATSFLASYAVMLTQLFSFLMLLAAMVLVDWRVVLAGLAFGLVIFLLGLRPLNRAARRIGEQGVGFARHTASIVGETIQGVRDLRLLRAEDKRLREVDGAVEQMTTNDFRGSLLQAVPTNAVELLLGLLLVGLAVILLGTGSGGLGLEQLPVLLFFLVSLFRLSTYGANVSSLYVKLVKRYPSFLAVVKAASKAQHREKAELATAPLSLARFRPAMGFSLQGLTFAYDTRAVLQSVNLDLPLGTITYLYGPSGSGKSSIADILARLHEPPSGAVLVDGRDATQFPLQTWREMIGYVSQDPVLFSGSLLENVRVGQPTASPNEVMQALDLAGAGEFIAAAPMGLDTMLVERGRNISGGQKCRLAIARALLRQPSLLILDESMGGIEVSLEADIISRLRAVPNLSVLVISHRKENAELADQVVELEAGELTVTQPLGRREALKA